MNPRWALFFKLVGLVILVVFLILLFPPVLEFAEGAAGELRFFWWLILLLILALWLIWGLGKKKK
jgi:type VI protein secretion system component VasK